MNREGYLLSIDARVGGDVNENSKLLKKAKERVERAVIILTTCAGESYIR